MPFGLYRDRPLAEIPVGYLRWLTPRVKPGPVRRALAAELRRRGVEVPPEPVPPEPTCPGCGSTAMRYRWHGDTVGRQHVKRFCAGCGRSLGFAPTDVYAAQANAAEAAREGRCPGSNAG
jgi:hypothetical protein